MKLYYLLLIVILSSTFYKAQTSEELSITFIKKLEQQKFDSCYAMFDTIMTNKFSADMLEQIWGGLPRYMGEYKSYSTITKEQKDSLEIVFIRCDFEKTKMDLQLVYNNPPRKIIGMFFTPPKNKAAYISPEYAQSNLYYETKIPLIAGKITLPGILCMPNSIKNPPLVILLAGSGPNDKDESIGPNKILKDLALGLASNGIATYRYDKRTLVYRNTLKNVTITTEVIEDALNAIDMLKKNPNLKRSQVYIVGHSLGAMCAPLVASKNKKIKGIVLLAGNARPLEDLLLEQYQYIFGLDSIDVIEKKEIDQLQEQIKIVKNKKALKHAKPELLPLNIDAIYWSSLNNYNQINTAKKIKQPILILQGERDYQVTMTDFLIWKQSLSDNSKNTFKSYPYLNHLFFTGTEKSVPSEYEKQNHVDKIIINDISDWIKHQ